MAAAGAASSSRQAEREARLPNVAIFPFMAKGHTIPLTHLAHLLLRRGLATVTFFTTPGNAAFVRAALSTGADGLAIVELPFPDHVSGVPPGVEGVEALESLSSAPAFVEAVSLLRLRFEEALAAMRPRAGLLVADALLYWAHASAAALGVPRVAFSVTSMFAYVMREVFLGENPAAVLRSDDGAPAVATFTVPKFPHVQLALADIPVPFNDPAPTGPIRDMDAKFGKAIADSNGFIINSFDAMEGRYVEHWNRHAEPRAWLVGPLCLARPTSTQCHGGAKPSWMQWLDEKAAAGRAVLYIALGTMLAVTTEQLREVADGVDRAGIDFIWAVRPGDADLGAGFEERVAGRGKVVREWVDQWAILQHECVKGFLSHCGWNSVVESVSAGVPLAAWPTGAEQPLNAKLVVDELRIGVRVLSAASDGLVGSVEVARAARELMAPGENGAEAARNVSRMAAKAREAVAEGGSSWKAVEEMIRVLCRPADATSVTTA